MATYRPCIVATLRVLGVSERLKADPEGTGRQALREVQQTLQRKAPTDVSEHRSLLLNDRLVIVVPIDSQPFAGSISKTAGSLLLRLLIGQLVLSTNAGLWIQGAVSAGEILLGRDSIFGPGLDRASRLKSSDRLPRIIVDPILIKHLLADVSPTKEDPVTRQVEALVSLGLHRSSYGKFFTDYLRVAGPVSDPATHYEGFLAQHKERVEARLSRMPETDVRYRMFVWLARYHNRTVMRYVKNTGAAVVHLLIQATGSRDPNS